MPCGGGCGKMVTRSGSSLPQPICHDCRRVWVPMNCTWCGTPVPRGNTLYCSREHMALGMIKHADPRSSNRAATRRRRAAHRSSWDGIEDYEIYERDSWVCQIPVCVCPSGRTIDRSAPHPTPWSGVIDHIVPLILTADDTAPNKRAAHYRCNARKGKRLDSELVR